MPEHLVPLLCAQPVPLRTQELRDRPAFRVESRQRDRDDAVVEEFEPDAEPVDVIEAKRLSIWSGGT